MRRSIKQLMVRGQKAFWLIALVGFLLGEGFSASAQAAIAKIAITRSVITTNFPQAIIQIRATDAGGQPVPSLGASDLVVTEQGNPVSGLSVSKIEVGLQIVFVLHPGSSPDALGQTGQSRSSESRAAINLFVKDYMQEGSDSVGLVAQNGSEASLLQSLTSTGKGVTDALTGYVPTSSAPIVPAIQLALSELSNATDSSDRYKAIVVLSSAWEVGTSQQLIDTAKAQGVQIHFIQVRRADEFADIFKGVASATDGLYVKYQGDDSLQGLYRHLTMQRDQYQLSFRSQIGDIGERNVVVQSNANPSANTTASTTYAVPDLQGPQVTFSNLQNSFVIKRHADQRVDDPASISPTAQTVGVDVSFPNYSERAVSQVELFVNGKSLGVKSGPGNHFEWNWELNEFNQKPSLDPIVTPVEIKVEAIDELGMKGTTTINGNVSFFNPIISNLICGTVRLVPLVGRSLSLACQALGITPIAVVLLIALVGVGTWAWFNQATVGKVAKAAAVRITDVYKRITQQTGGHEPKAYLHALQGIDPGGRTVFEIYGETPLGRSPEHAHLVFHTERERSPISSLHCTIHEEEVNGTWSIEDEDSTNGTWLNGKRLNSMERSPMKEGDIIELGQVERGGLKFRFALADGADAAPSKDLTQAPIETLNRGPRVTRPTRDPGASSSGDGGDDLDNFDPTREDF